MSELTLTFKAVDFGPVWLVGKETTVEQGKTATAFVKKFRNDGSNAYLQGLNDRVSPEGDIIIWMGGYNPVTKSFIEIPGVFAKPGCKVEEGYTIRELPQCIMGICTISGETRSLSRGAHNKLVKLMKEAGYEPDYSFGYSMEYYSYEKYECDNEVYEFSYCLPCVKK